MSIESSKVKISVNNLAVGDEGIYVVFGANYNNASAFITSPLIASKPRRTIVRRALKETRPQIKEWVRSIKITQKEAFQDLIEEFAEFEIGEEELDA